MADVSIDTYGERVHREEVEEKKNSNSVFFRLHNLKVFASVAGAGLHHVAVPRRRAGLLHRVEVGLEAQRDLKQRNKF
jgi:hypothetical protein